MDIAHAYGEEAGINSYTRTVIRHKEEKIVIHDKFEPDLSVLGNDGFPVLSLITSVEPRMRVQQEILYGMIANANVKIAFMPEEHGTYRIEKIPVTDPRLQTAWPPFIYRMLIPFKQELTVEIV